MWVEVDIAMTGGDHFHRAFGTMGARADDLTEPLTAVAELMMSEIGENFASEGGSGKDKWEPLSEPYATRKEAKWGQLPILVSGSEGADGGRVIGAMRRTVLNAEEAMHIDPQRLLYEPDSAVAYYHQVGTDNMPARPPVQFTEAEMILWNREFTNWIMGSFTGSMGRLA